MKKRLIPELAAVLAVVLMLLLPARLQDYRRYETDTLSYLPARVLQVQQEQLEYNELSGCWLGQQRLLVRLADGRELFADNYLTHTHSILAQEGSRLIICADEPEQAEPYYTVYQQDRTLPILVLAALFALLLVLAGGRKGLDAFLAIGFSLCFFLRVLVPALYGGANPLAMGVLAVAASTAVTLALMHGFTGQCLLGVAATLLGELAAAALFALFSRWLGLTALQTPEGEGLLMIALNTGLQLRSLLQAGMMISALGAVMDVAVSVLSALREVAAASPDSGRAVLMKSGMALGRDLIGTMSNTLIFAFVGGSLSAMLVLISAGVRPHQLLSSDFLALELSQGLCSTCAVILTVPVSAALGAVFFGKK